MNTTVIDNPDLHLELDAELTIIASALKEILRTEYTLVTDILNFDFEGLQTQVWVHLRTNEHPKYRTSLSVYGTTLTFEQAKKLSIILNCDVISDFDPSLKQHQWQLIEASGSVKVINVDL